MSLQGIQLEQAGSRQQLVGEADVALDVGSQACGPGMGEQKAAPGSVPQALVSPNPRGPACRCRSSPKTDVFCSRSPRYLLGYFGRHRMGADTGWDS